MATHDKDVDFQKVSINHATLLEIAPLFLLSARWRWCAIGDSFLSFFFFFIFNLVLCIDYFSSWFLVSWWSSTSVGITVFIITSTARIWTRIEIFAGQVFKGNICTVRLAIHKSVIFVDFTDFWGLSYDLGLYKIWNSVWHNR